MNKRLTVIPKLPDEASERAFWETKDSTGHVNWQKGKVTAAAFARLHKNGCQCPRPPGAGCAVSVTHQGSVAGEGAGITRTLNAL